MENSVDPDETAHYEPSHLDLHCLHKYLFWSARLKGYVNTLCLDAKMHVLTVYINIIVITLSTGIERPEQIVQTLTAASDLGLHCLPLIQQFLDTRTGTKIDLFKF